MYFRTHPKPESVGQAGRWQSPYLDTMIDHDKVVGSLLDKLDELGIAEDTIFMYSTDNGPHVNTWPDAGMTPFRNEKTPTGRAPSECPAWCVGPARSWPGRSPTKLSANMDWLPTFVAAAGEPDVKAKLLQGRQAGGTSFKVHLDGYNLLPYLTGAEAKSPRPGFINFSDDGDLTALRFDNWKIIVMEQRATGTLRIWAEPFVPLRVPKTLQSANRPY